MPVANARMYSATPQLRADWKALLAWVLQQAGLPDGVMPDPLDKGCSFQSPLTIFMITPVSSV